MTGNAVGKHRAGLTRGGRATVGVFAAILVVGAVASTALFWGDDPVEPVCARPEDLETRRGVTLTPEALEAFGRAEELAGRRIEVVESFRSCRRQARVCNAICGNREGCPGTCAPPGFSWHQRGLAVDITQAMLDTPGVVEVLEEAGWCQALPSTDPGHFSFDGCH